MSGEIFLGSAEISVGEADGQVLIPIERTGDLSSAVTIEYGTTNNGATSADYVGVSGTITIPAGQSQVLVPVTILNDALSEATEAFTFSVITVSSGTLLFPRTTNVSILDDENPVVDPPNPPLTSDFETNQVTVIEDGLTQPIAFEFSPSDSNVMIVANKTGLIKQYNIETGQELPDLLDLRSVTNNIADRGLLDIELHPDFENNPYIYIYHVVDPPETAGQTGRAGPDGGGNRYAQVVRYELDADQGFQSVVAGSKTVIVGAAGQSLSDISGNGAVDSTSTSNINFPESGYDPVTDTYVNDYLKLDSLSHAGGSIEFGPDGALYVSTGDGTSFNAVDPRSVSVQDVNSLSGKILRVDGLTGEGLADNPFATNDLSENASKVYQLGLRNPFSMAFDEAGRLMITDTGWNRWEEINSGPPGANFGWPFYEGGDNGQNLEANGYSNLPEADAFYAAVADGSITITPAFRAFAHASNAPGFQVQAITGADSVIDSALLPASLQGYYIFTDVSQGEVFAVDSNDRRQVEFLFRDPDNFAPVHFKQGPDGNIYYADLRSNTIGRLEITDPNEPDAPDAPGGFTAEYFAIDTSVTVLSDVDFSATPLVTTTVDRLNESGADGFYAGGPDEYFAARYTAQFDVSDTGDYTFYLTSDDGSQLFIDGVLVINNDGLHGPIELEQTVELDGGSHSIEIIYFERTGGATIDLDWSSGFAREQFVLTESSTGNSIEGTPGSDLLNGTAGDDVMNGNGGGDFFFGSTGNDAINGTGGEYDQVDYAGFRADYTFTENADGTVTASGPLNDTDTLSGIDGFWFQTEQAWFSLAQVLEGSPPRGDIVGTNGDDVLDGTPLDDVMAGLGGSDTFNTSLGDDVIRGNAADYSQVDFDGAASDITFVRNADGSITASGAQTGTDTLFDIDGVWFGGEQQWYAIGDLIQSGTGPINGTSGNDDLSGTAGDDVMNGNGGSDIFNGSLGDDIINGNAGDYDQVDYNGSASDYGFTRNADGTVTVSGALTGTDTLSEIDGFWFRGEGAWYAVDELTGSSASAKVNDLLVPVSEQPVVLGENGDPVDVPVLEVQPVATVSVEGLIFETDVLMPDMGLIDDMAG